MISGGDIANGTGGTLAMARNRAGWSDRLDMSGEQVFKSFWAFLLTLPAHLLAVEGSRRLLVTQPGFQGGVPGPTANAVAETIVFLSVWAIELMLLVSLANRREVGWRVSPLIIGYNWSTFLARTAQGLAIGATILLPFDGLGVFALMIATGFAVWLQWGVIRRCLKTTSLGTVGVIGLLIITHVGVATILTVLFQLIGLVPQGATA